jgi:hypothetical protein
VNVAIGLLDALEAGARRRLGRGRPDDDGRRVPQPREFRPPSSARAPLALVIRTAW